MLLAKEVVNFCLGAFCTFGFLLGGFSIVWAMGIIVTLIPAGSSGAETVMILGKWKVFHARGGLACLSARACHYMLHLVFFLFQVFFLKVACLAARMFSFHFRFFSQSPVLVIFKGVMYVFSGFF